MKEKWWFEDFNLANFFQPLERMAFSVCNHRIQITKDGQRMGTHPLRCHLLVVIHVLVVPVGG